MNYDFDDTGSLGYCSDPQFSPEHNFTWPQSDHNSVTWIEFTEQPADYRYRYLKEKYHGHIVGVSSPATKKKDMCKFPKLKLFNYNGSAIVRVWLISTQLDKPQAHFHKLARKPPKGELKLEPHDFRACEQNNYEVTLDYLHIVHAVSNDENDINVYRKKKAHIESGAFDPPGVIPSSSKEEKDEIKQIDKNQSLFYIQVFDEKTRTRICESIVSQKIKNLHNAETGALKIVNCSRTFGTCRGNDEVFIFVEKISKDVEVRFFRLNNKNEKIWTAPAIYGPQHVHHQLGIVFRTPKFPQNIEKDTQVFFELHRKNDGAVSEPISFTFKPHEEYKSNDMVKKRPRSPEIMSSEDDYLPSVLPSYGAKRIKDESMSPDSTTINHISVETIPLNNIMYSPYATNNLLQPIEDEISDMSSIFPSLNQNVLTVNDPTTTLVDNTDSWVNELLDLGNHSFLANIQCDSVVLSKDTLDEVNIQCDSVILSKDAPDEDTDDEHVVRAQGPIYISASEKPSSNGISKSHPKSERKMSRLTKVDLLLVLSEKVPIEEFNSILESTVDINSVDYEGNSALHYAARSSVDYLEPLLRREDVDRNLKNLWGDDVLLDAARSDSIDVVRLLLEKDFEPNVRNSRTGETPLHLAVSNENYPMAALLLEHGADPLLGNHSDQSAYDYSMNCNGELRRLMHFLMQKSMFQKRKTACSNEASHSSPENELACKLNELTV